MREDHQELAERIRGEVQDLEQVIQRVQEVWPQAQRNSPEHHGVRGQCGPEPARLLFGGRTPV